jgi:uncharacterized cupredoxin-like copper-binding protein
MLKKALALVALGSMFAAAAAIGGSASPAVTNVAVTAGKPSELRFTLSKKTVAKGRVVFKVTNRGKSNHDFKIARKKIKTLRPGKSATLIVALRVGKYPYVCTLPGHAAAGMKGVVTVK